MVMYACAKKMLTHSHNLIFPKAIPTPMKLSYICIFDSDTQIWRISNNVLKQNHTFLDIFKRTETRGDIWWVELTMQQVTCLYSEPNWPALMSYLLSKYFHTYHKRREPKTHNNWLALISSCTAGRCLHFCLEFCQSTVALAAQFHPDI